MENTQKEIFINEEENLIEEQGFLPLQGLTIVYPFGSSLYVRN